MSARRLKEIDNSRIGMIVRIREVLLDTGHILYVIPNVTESIFSIDSKRMSGFLIRPPNIGRLLFAR